MNTVFHAGELAVQQRAGVQQMAARVGNGIRPVISSAAAQFLAERPFAIIAMTDKQSQTWASLLTGDPPFIYTLDKQTVQIKTLPHTADPLLAGLENGGDVGLLAIDFATRRRMRLNGVAHADNDGFTIKAQQVYANCPKYIQARHLSMQPQIGDAPHTCITQQLSEEQQRWLETADTFFIASAHPEGGADASHRGGHAGFVQVLSPTQLIWPDYAGNMMFNTLGNIAANPSVGLLFLDFVGNRTLQLTGQAKIVWDEVQISQFIGAERLVLFEIVQVIETQNALPFS
jgi:predicted pyridoxine 5'-phosphate oxidase superfamily flavin-nucleotide-binding protein